MMKILLLEDDRDIGKVVENALVAEQLAVEWTQSGQDALSRLSVSNYDLLILDWNVPDLSGMDVCTQFRSRGGKTLILMLTGKDQLNDKVTALDGGADDYLTKPFHTKELLARVRALLRRDGTKIVTKAITVGDISLDAETHSVTRAGVDIPLLPREFALLELFLRYPGVVFSQEAIFKRVWSSEDESSTETVRTHVKNLRKKLEATGQPAPIETLHKVGYRLTKP